MSSKQGISITSAGSTNAYFAAYVSGCDDINADGYDDVIIGAASQDNNKGRVVAVYGRQYPYSLNVTDISLDQGFTLYGVNTGDYTGKVGRAGDVNNDGYADFLVGAPHYPAGSANGRVYVIYGNETSSLTDLNLSYLNSSTGFSFIGENKGDYAGNSLGQQNGDFNNDGIDDVIFGAPDYLAGNYKGRTYVIFGKNSTD
jgi:hypothetical protein